MATRQALLGLGGNVGDTESLFVSALTKLAEAGVRLCQVSQLYVTCAVTRLDAHVTLPDVPVFTNAALRVATSLTPEKLLDCCLAIEAELGRDRSRLSLSRSLDIDLLLFEGATRESARLTLPHPRMRERYFVLAPLKEVAPDWQIPPSQARVQALYDAVSTDAGHVTVRRSAALERCITMR